MDSNPPIVLEMSSNPVFRIWHTQFEPTVDQPSCVEFSIHSDSSHQKIWMSALKSGEPIVLHESENPLTGQPVQIDVERIMSDDISSYKLICIMLDSLEIDVVERKLVAEEIISTARKIIHENWNQSDDNLWSMAVEISITTVKLCKDQKTN